MRGTMRKLSLGLLLILAICLVPVGALAQEIVPPSGADFQALFASLGGLAGMKALAIVAVVIQAMMLLVRSQAGELLGKYRFLIVYAGSMILAPIALISSGVSVGAAFVHANTLAAIQVFLNQIFKQFIVKKD